METCKYGSGADKRKPTAVKRKGVVYRAYRLHPRNSSRIWTGISRRQKTSNLYYKHTDI